MSFKQLIEACLTSGSQPTLWLSYNDRLAEKLSTTGKERSSSVSQTWVALLETLEQYGSISGLPASYIREALTSNRYPVESLLQVLVKSTEHGFSSNTVEAVSTMLPNSPDFGKANLKTFDRTTKPNVEDTQPEQPLRFLRHFIQLLSSGTPRANELVAQLISQQMQGPLARSSELPAAAQALLEDTSLVIPAAIREALTSCVDASSGKQEHDEDEGLFQDQRQEQRPVRSATPDPLVEESPDGINTVSKTYKYIQTPAYITCALQSALELGWQWSSPRRKDPRCNRDYQMADDDLGMAPDSQRDLIHLISALLTKPSTMLYFLVQTSFEVLFASVVALRNDVKREAQQATQTAEDQAMLGIASAASNTERDRIAAGVFKTGWKEMIWMLYGLVSTLRYWRWLDARDEANPQWSKARKLPDDLTEVLAVISNRYEKELEDINELLWGPKPERPNDDRSFMGLFIAQLVRASLLSAEQTQGLGVNVSAVLDRQVSPTQLAAVDLLGRYAMASETSAPTLIYDTYSAPQLWPDLCQSLRDDLSSFWPIPNGTVPVMHENFALLQIACQIVPPTVLLKETLKALRSESIRHAINDDPQATLTNYGSLVFLANTICYKNDLPLPAELRQSCRVQLVNELVDDEALWLKGWIQAIFGSTGISDELLQSTQPHMLLRLATTLVSQAVSATVSQVIDIETLHSGLSYFSQPLLSWCVSGILKWLSGEIQRQGMFAPIYLDVMQLLLLSEEIPQSTIEAISSDVLDLFEKGNGLELVLQSSELAVDKLNNKLRTAQVEPALRAVSIEQQRDWIPLLRHQLQRGDADVNFTANQAVFAMNTTEIILTMAEVLSLQSTGERLFVVLYLGLIARPDLVSLLVQLQGRKDMRGGNSVNVDFLGECCNVLVHYMGVNGNMNERPYGEVSAVLTKVASRRSSATPMRRARARNE